MFIVGLLSGRGRFTCVYLNYLCLLFCSSLASKYEPNTTLQRFLKSRWCLVTILLGEYLFEIPYPVKIAFKHIITNCIKFMVIWSGRQEYGTMLIIPLPRSFAVIDFLSTSHTCSCVAAMLTSTSPDLLVNFSKSISIFIIHIMKPPLPYNFITLFKLLLSCHDVRLGMWSAVTKLAFFADIITNKFTLKT